MNKTIKKIMALVLTVIMLMSVAVVACAESYVDPETGVTVQEVETTAPADEPVEEHRMFFDIFVEFWEEVFAFFKYIFYDVFRGEPAYK